MEAFKKFKSKKDGQYYFNFLNIYDENKTLFMGEGYTSIRNRNVGINSVKAHGLFREYYHLKTATDGRTHFLLIASNGEPIGSSIMWDSVDIAEEKIKVCMRILKTFKK